MCITKSVVLLVGLYVGFTHSWDIAVSLKDQLIFYNNGTKTSFADLISQNPTSLAYDELHNSILYVDKQNGDDAICSYDLTTKQNKYIVKRNGRNIQGLAFDPITELVFFTDAKERSINWVSLKPGSHNSVYGNLLFKMDDDHTPADIAVDSCRGFIYWINKNNISNKRMGKARFNGSEREDIFQRNFLYPLSLAIDPQKENMYYFDGCKTCSPADLNRADLQGEHENIVKRFQGDSTVSNLMSVAKDYVYWVRNNTVWQIVKNKLVTKEIIKFRNEIPLGLVANYKIDEQIWAPRDCEALSSLIQPLTVTNNSFSILQIKRKIQTIETVQTTEAKLFCVHGTKVSETSVCKCTPGYIGERCDVSVCENYCLQGYCSVNDEGLPQCSCHAGFSGRRCEVDACRSYCLNNGDCFLNEAHEPFCQCTGNHEGARCETTQNYTLTTIPSCDSAETNLTLANLVSKCINYCFQGTCSFNEMGLPICSCYNGYSGLRCEIYACHGYCLNYGDCSLNEEDDPVCQCVGTYEGSRCEVVKNYTFTANNTSIDDSSKKNVTLADLLSSWRTSNSKVYVTVKNYY